MGAVTALISKIAVLSLMLVYTSASAQDVAPQTPPELRDFRLDPQPAKPTVQPDVDPAPVIPPPAVRTAPDADAPVPRVLPPTAAPTPRQTAEVPAIPPTGGATAENVTIVPPQVDADPSTPGDVAPEISEQPQQPLPPTPENQGWWQIATVLGVIGIILAAFYALRRSRSRLEEPDADIVEPVESAEPSQATMPVDPAPIFAPSIPNTKPRIIIDFVPEKASISVATLTVKGQLRVINESDHVAKNMLLRAVLISASANQGAEIAAFHLGSNDKLAQSIGDAGARERIGMALELTVPLADMQSFPLGKQKLFVPLLVANLAYDGDDGMPSEVAQIACMIGRESDPPTPKMAPLRLDLGPRSFAPLGQRLVLT